MCIYLIPQHGLCNRLSWICGFYSYNRAMSHRCLNKECMCYIKWSPAPACNGHFLEIFKLLPHSKFVKDDNEVPSGIKRYTGQHSIPNVYSKILKVDIITPEVECGIFGLLRFNDEVRKISHEFINKYFNKNNTIGLHVRRTDHIGLAKGHGNYTNDKYFFKVIENEIKKDPEVVFFLSTDNRNTQEMYLNKYPKNVVVYKKIEKLKNSFRHTSLFDTGIDMSLLTYCKRVEGSFHSSFSRIAVMLNLNRRREIGKATEELNQYVFHQALFSSTT